MNPSQPHVTVEILPTPHAIFWNKNGMISPPAHTLWFFLNNYALYLLFFIHLKSSFNSLTPAIFDISENLFPFSYWNDKGLAALTTTSMTSYDCYCILFCQFMLKWICLHFWIDSNDNILSNTIMNVESACSNTDGSNFQANFMNFFLVFNFNIERFSSNFEEFSTIFVCSFYCCR